MAEDAPLEVTELMLICNGCGGERMVYFDVPLVGAAGLIAWLKGEAETGPTPCRCGAKTCDVRVPLKAPSAD